MQTGLTQHCKQLVKAKILGNLKPGVMRHCLTESANSDGQETPTQVAGPPTNESSGQVQMPS